MEHGFWHQRWAEGRIGFHQAEVNALLQAHWQGLDLEAGVPVFVPLCGKSSDMHWLCAQGHPVLGVELSEQACEAYFAEAGISPEEFTWSGGKCFRGGGAELLCGDIFAVDAGALAPVRAVYDRAALVALPPVMRSAYAEFLCRVLSAGVVILLISMEFDGEEGPPFSVGEAEVWSLYGARFEVERIAVASGESGRSDVVYRLRDRAG